MPKFIYEALDAKGRVIVGEVEAPSPDFVYDDLRRVRYTVTSVKEKVDRPDKLVGSVFHRFRGVSLYALAVFTRQLATLIHAGVPVVRAMEALSMQNIQPQLTQAVRQVTQDLKEGYSLSRALSRQQEVFSPIYVSMVRAGEVSGAMDEILDRLASYLEREFTLRKKIQAAVAYPFLVFCACVALTLFLVNYVFPMFVSLFEGISVKLPWTTRTLIAVTQTCRNPAVMVPILVTSIVAYFGISAYVQTPIGRRHWDQIVLQLPLYGRLQHKIALNRMCRTLSTMMDGGIPLIHALKSTGYAVNNAVIADQLEDVAMAMRSGCALATPMAEHPTFPRMLVQMVAVGEEAGNLALMLRKMSDFLEDEVDYLLQSMLSLIEPIMVGLMGAIVGFILVAVFSPIYGLLQQF